eukprot:TRINITY_DN51939_c0_g1_i1.p1 TRINITY_DN51939_c0_g1~~TRINITY_DN51939_c0_g1_i1.p1  ORF type:complete len:324 (+),score=72.61 TRINITY_DN51939_c0_g1_i1:121-1092(+)
MDNLLACDEEDVVLISEDASSDVSTCSTSYSSSTSGSSRDEGAGSPLYYGSSPNLMQPRDRMMDKVNTDLEDAAGRLQRAQLGVFDAHRDDGVDVSEGYVWRRSDDEAECANASEHHPTAPPPSAKPKTRRKRRRRKTVVPPPKHVSGKKGSFAVKVHSRTGGTVRRPTVLATFRRVPKNGEAVKVGGFSKRKVLVDSGATRTAITADMAVNILKLKPQGSTHVTTGDGVKTKRMLVRTSIEVCGVVSYIWATVRPPHALKHCILGVDWLGTTRPEWVYTEKKKKTVRRRDTAPAATSSASLKRKGSKKTSPVANEVRKTSVF